MKDIIFAKKHARKIAKAENIQIKDAMLRIANEQGFKSWKLYKNSLDTHWYSKSSPFLNHWFTTHKEAKEYLCQNGGYLLTYKGQYFVVSADYIQFLGLDSNHPVWQTIGFDTSLSHHMEKIYKVFFEK